MKRAVLGKSVLVESPSMIQRESAGNGNRLLFDVTERRER